MMPLAPHMSPPSADGTDTSSTITTTGKIMASKPKLAFSIDSIVNTKADNTIRDHKVGGHKRSVSPTVPDTRLSAKRERHSSPVPTNPSPSGSLSASPSPPPAPVNCSNISGPYRMAPGDHHSHHQPYPIHPQAMPMSHSQHPLSPHQQLMMATMAANHMSPQQIPQPQSYHQAMAMMANPWLMRANPFAMNRFHGMPFDGAFLLPPFRKPKRIRTAFSPGQLLKLEQAFEKNHYVVGQERKQLAAGLGLSETQVKVWFQNRRTKHKRQKNDGEDSGDEGSAGGRPTGAGGGADGKSDNDDDGDRDADDEDVDMSDDEGDSAGRLMMAQAGMWPYGHMMVNPTAMASTSQTSGSQPPCAPSLAANRY